MFNTKPEMRVIFTVLLVLFALFLAAPLVMLFIRSIQSDSGLTVANYTSLVMNPELVQSFLNSVNVSLTTAVITTVLGCLLAYTVHFTNLFRPLKGVLRIAVIMPMLLPTITYGFAIMYSFGNQGLMTQLFGQFFSIYGFNGVLLGYVIYTLPPVFLLIHNAFGYLDKRFVIVSQLMGDKPLRTFMTTTVRPLAGALGGAFVLSFILSFTDFGIPASIGGTYPLLPTQLYTIMLGAIPDLNRGAAVAIIMLIPSVLAMWLMRKLEKLNFSYDSLNPIELPRSRVRDIVFGIVSYAVVISMVATFLIIFIAPWLGIYAALGLGSTDKLLIKLLYIKFFIFGHLNDKTTHQI
jgi:iron(III) transport system permease protein